MMKSPRVIWKGTKRLWAVVCDTRPSAASVCAADGLFALVGFADAMRRVDGGFEAWNTKKGTEEPEKYQGTEQGAQPAGTRIDIAMRCSYRYRYI
jgi:hypothetical protein